MIKELLKESSNGFGKDSELLLKTLMGTRWWLTRRQRHLTSQQTDEGVHQK